MGVAHEVEAQRSLTALEDRYIYGPRLGLIEVVKLCRIHLENVIIWGPNGTSGNPVLGFNAHQGAQVPVDLKIVAAWPGKSGPARFLADRG